MLPKLTNIFGAILLVLLAFVACKPKTDTADLPQANADVEKVKELEEKLRNASGENEALPIAQELEDVLIVYATEHPKDTLSAMFLYKAARLNEAYFSKYEEAFGLYEDITTIYPDTRFAPVALFKKGLIMETVFLKSDKAIYYLDEFLKKYPNHKLSAMASQIISSSGVDADVLFERMHEK